MNISEVIQSLTTSSRTSPKRTNRLEKILEDFLKALERGTEPNRERIIQDNPDLADVLRENFAKLDMLHQTAAGGEAQKLDIDISGMQHLRMNPDGKRFAFVVGETMREVWIMEKFLSEER